MPRKKVEKTIHYLYKTTCLVTGRYYIGMHSTSNLEDGYMGSGKRLRYSIRKYGLDNHKKEILGFFESRELLIEAEKKAITEDMITDNNCMNIMSGGTGGFISIEASRKGGLILQNKFKGSVKQKVWSAKGGSKRFKLYGIPKKLKQDWLGRKHSEETKLKMRKPKNIGETNSQYGTCWITKDGLNKKIKKENLESYINDGWVKGRK
jgi:hypothetical protein